MNGVNIDSVTDTAPGAGRLRIPGAGLSPNRARIVPGPGAGSMQPFGNRLITARCAVRGPRTTSLSVSCRGGVLGR